MKALERGFKRTGVWWVISRKKKITEEMGANQTKRGKGVFHKTSSLSKGRDWETAGKWFCVTRSSVATGEWMKNGELIAAQIVLEFS